MSVESEMDSLAGESIAVQTMLVGLCIELQKAGLTHIVEGALAYTDAVLEAGTLQLGANARLGHVKTAIEVAEAMREATIGNKGGPQQGV